MNGLWVDSALAINWHQVPQLQLNPNMPLVLIKLRLLWRFDISTFSIVVIIGGRHFHSWDEMRHIYVVRLPKPLCKVSLRIWPGYMPVYFPVTIQQWDVWVLRSQLCAARFKLKPYFPRWLLNLPLNSKTLKSEATIYKWWGDLVALNGRQMVLLGTLWSSLPLRGVTPYCY